MNDTISKQKLLEWLDKSMSYTNYLFAERAAYGEVKRVIESGTFDTDEQRLKMALEQIASIKYNALGYSPEDAECMNRIATEALSSEPKEDDI